MDWTTVICSLLGVIFGSGGTYLMNIKAARKKAMAEADITASEEWHKLYTEQHERNVELSAKVDELVEENTKLRLENQELKQQISRNTDDIKELRDEIRRIRGIEGN